MIDHDWRDLLIRYMRLVIERDGISFVEYFDGDDEETAALEGVEREAAEEYWDLIQRAS
jgi:very-short-patch-repair endonuclease